MSSKARSIRRSTSPVSSRTRASPSNGASGAQQRGSSRRSASVPLTLPSRTSKASPTTTSKPSAPPAISKTALGNQAMSHALPTVLADSVSGTQLNPLTNVRLRQAIRAQYGWAIPLDAGYKPHLSALPDAKEKAVAVGEEKLYNYAFQSRYLHRILALKLSFSADTQNYSLRSDGKPFPYRGQGPVWDQNSCHLDVCIVAARMLNVGCTIADRSGLTRDSWIQALQPVQRKFLDLISVGWEDMDKQTNIKRRHHFWDHELASLKGIAKRPDFGWAIDVWDKCTSQMGQFGFEKSQGFSSCKHCGAVPTSKTVAHHQFLSLDMSHNHYEEFKSQFGESRKPIGWWIGRELKPFDKRCGACRNPSGRSRECEIVGALPRRLVVVPGQYVQGLVSGATSDYVQFSYCSSDGEQKATYRWLGGIYCRSRHFRLYWTDGEKGSPYPQVRIYDGRQAFGAIIGGVPVTNIEDKVPSAWSRAPTILFYERIDEVALSIAANNIRGLIDSALGDALRLESIGAQGPVDSEPHLDGPQNYQGGEELTEQMREAEQESQPSALVGNGEAEDPEPTVDRYKISEVSSQQAKTGNTDTVQPGQSEDNHPEEREEVAKEPSEAGEELENSDSESSLSSPLDNRDDEEDKNGSDNDSNTQSGNQNQEEDYDKDEEEEEEANGDNAPKDSGKDAEREGKRSPPTSPTKTPPMSAADPPKTPPPQIQRTGLFSSFSPSKLFGLFTPSRSGSKTEPPTAVPAPPSSLRPADKNIDDLADDTPDTSPLSSDDDDMSLVDNDSDDDPGRQLVTPPVSPAKKKTKTVTSSITLRRRSQRTFKPRTSARTAQMIPPNTRTAGSMGPYKPLPASRGQVSYDGGNRGRSSIRMNSVIVGQKRSSSASSVSSTGSSVGGGGSGRGSSSAVVLKRVRF
ncbi:MAG: hypothetical protein Q9209_000132 [Squamulea sp. 1 TL-2023]